MRIRSQEEQEKVIDGKVVDGVGVEGMVERRSGVMGWSGMVVAVGCRGRGIRETRRAMTGVRVSGCRFWRVCITRLWYLANKKLELHMK